MKIIYSMLICLSVVLGLTTIADATEYTYTNTELGFTTTFPGQDVRISNDTDGVLNITFKETNSVYAIMTRDTGEISNPQKLKLLVNNIAASINGFVVRTRSLKLNKYDGIEVFIKAADIDYTARIYFVKSRLYLIVVAGYTNYNLPMAIDTFFNSFRLLP